MLNPDGSPSSEHHQLGQPQRETRFHAPETEPDESETHLICLVGTTGGSKFNSGARKTLGVGRSIKNSAEWRRRVSGFPVVTLREEKRADQLPSSPRISRAVPGLQQAATDPAK
jgi:hypothetical protein